ncbi:hypothetical protein [Paracoccus sp. TOH]|uniref:hypothetical protein n=1 Tax=Paracoccus sp. TOH TaxID=1263728 RepID=UPI0025B05737|nr:hypothetical protein [Paracoccus sp. TOH]WJS83454.1 hypothetical protein NBE95_06620 [Paracoccus sp. TOH]
MMRRAGLSGVRPGLAAASLGSLLSFSVRSLHTGQPCRAMDPAAGIRPIPAPKAPALPVSHDRARVSGHADRSPFPDLATRARPTVRAKDRVRHLPPKE